MEAFISALMSNVVFRTAIEEITIKILADIFHRRASDPNFLSSSDAAFSALSAAKTEEEINAAQSILRNIMSNG